MADDPNKTNPSGDPVPPNSGNQGEPTPAADDPLKGIDPKVLEALKAQTVKEMQSEIDRRVSKFVGENNDLKKKLEAAELEKMNEKQKAEYELKKREDALKEQENRILSERANYLKSKAISEAGLPSDVFDFVAGVSEQEITANTAKLKALFDSYHKAGVEAALKGAGGKPVTPGGAAPDPSKLSDADYIKARQAAVYGKK